MTHAKLIGSLACLFAAVAMAGEPAKVEFLNSVPELCSQVVLVTGGDPKRFVSATLCICRDRSAFSPAHSNSCLAASARNHARP